MITMVMIMIIVTWGLPSLCFFFCSCSTSPRGLWQSPRLSGYHDHDHCCHNSMITFEDILPASSRSSHHRIFVRITFFVTLSPSSLAVEFWIPKEKRCKSAWQECCAAVAYILVPSMSFVFILVPAHTLLLEFLRINPKWNPHLIAWCACNGTPKLL